MLLAAGAVSCAPAFAAPDAARDAGPDHERDEIFVTAGWRGLSVDEAPVLAVALDRRDVIDRRAFDIDGLFSLLPGVEMIGEFTPRASLFNCRNAGQAANAPLGCGVLIDGVPVVEARLVSAQVFAVESVVFTTGAQAVNAPGAVGGLVSIDTIAPGAVFEGAALASLGENGHVRVQGGAGGPALRNAFGGDLGLRLDGFYERSDGRNRNAFLDAPTDFIDGRWGLRARAVYTRDWLELDVKAGYGFYNQGAAFLAANLANDPNVFVESRSNRLGRARGQDWNATARASVDLSAMLDGAEFSIVGDVTRGDETAFQDLDFSNLGDLPGGAFGPGGPDAGTGSIAVLGFDLRSNVIEARLSRPNDETRRVGWEAAVLRTWSQIIFPAQIARDNPAIPTDVIRVNVDPSAVFFAQNFLDERGITAVRAQVDVDVTERLNLAGAIRYEETDIASVDRVGGITRAETFEAVSWNAVASYEIAPELRVFASYRKGNRAGGFNPAGLGAFDMETRREVEGGFNAALLGGRARLRAIGFCGWTDGLQVFTLDGAAQRVNNFPGARNCGAEGAVNFAVNSAVHLYANYSITATEITDAPDRPDLIGNATPNSFDTVNVGGDLRLPLGSGFTLIGGADARLYGARIWDPENDFREDATLVANLRLGLERGRFAVSIVAENVADARRYEQFVGPPASGRVYSVANPNDRRRLSATIEARF